MRRYASLMQINDDDIQDIIRIYEDVYGERLSFEEARKVAARLGGFYEALAGLRFGERNPEEPANGANSLS